MFENDQRATESREPMRYWSREENSRKRRVEILGRLGRSQEDAITRKRLKATLSRWRNHAHVMEHVSVLQ